MRIETRTDIPNTYRVYSGEEIYDVDLRSPFAPDCSCPDFIWRNRICRHIRSCLNQLHGEPE